MKVKLDEVVFDAAIYPREQHSTATVKQYVDGLRAGNVFPAIVLEEKTTQEEIGEAVGGLSQGKISEKVSELLELIKGILSDLTKGHDCETVAERHALYLPYVWALKLEGKEDSKLSALCHACHKRIHFNGGTQLIGPGTATKNLEDLKRMNQQQGRCLPASTQDATLGTSRDVGCRHDQGQVVTVPVSRVGGSHAAPRIRCEIGHDSPTPKHCVDVPGARTPNRVLMQDHDVGKITP